MKLGERGQPQGTGMSIIRQVRPRSSFSWVLPKIIPSIDLQPDSVTVSEGAIFSIDLADKVLVAEIPKSGARWKQVNFTKDNFINFFGATLDGTQQRVLFYHVTPYC